MAFVNECSCIQKPTYRGYRLLACDGSDVNIARTPSDEETFIREGEKGYSMLHINALYDLLNHSYCDFIIQGKKKPHERQALNSMVDRYHEPAPAIFIADRGYESFNVFAHMILKEQKFIIRIKDIASNGILSSNISKPHLQEDIQWKQNLIPRFIQFFHPVPILTSWIKVHILTFTFALSGSSWRMEATCVNTNLAEDEFPLEEIKQLYRLRWGEETSFRQLKYTIGLVNFHSRKKEFIIQEVYARMILYNFCELATQHTVVITKRNRDFVYRIA